LQRLRANPACKEDLMRRKLAITAALAMGAGIIGIAPAQAQVVPVTVIVTEGVGLVCGAASLTPAQATKYGNSKPGATGKHAWCIYPGTPGYDLAVNPGQTTHPQWWETGYKNGSKFQGLFLPGVGPGANGPYSLTITGAPNPPANVCVDSVEGPGCTAKLAGRLTPGPIAGHGAYAGGSQGTGEFTFTSATGQYNSAGNLGWNQSAATILPLQGSVTSGSDAGASIVGFTSSRGVTGDSSAGNAGVQLPTTGFQVEGMLVAY
jgi:hypothetical protein